MRKHILLHSTNRFSLVNATHVVSPPNRFLQLLLLLTVSLGLSAQCSAPAGEILGQVYLDRNFNGSYDASDSPYGQVAIRAFDAAGQLAGSAVSDANGEYRLTGLSGQWYRLEMVRPQGMAYARSGSQGANDVKFIQAPACQVYFGLQDHSLIWSPEVARVYTTCFVKAGGDDTAPTLVGLPFNFKSNTMPAKLAMQNQTGSVWGLAWNTSRQLLYSSAYVKYGAALGQAGTGGIYQTNPLDQSTQLFADLRAMGVQTGDLSAFDPLACSYSDWVGRAGLGDMDISDNDQLLFVTNLYRNSLVIIPTEQPTPASVMEVTVPDPGCGGGDYAVSAVEYHNGQVYIGVTCTAESSKTDADFAFHIYEFNLLSKTFNLVFSTDFGREYWLKQPGSARPVSQWLTSIAFTTDDFMVLGVTDRTGHTYCDPVYPLTGSSGDILMLWKAAGAWKLEYKGVAGSRTGSGPFNFEGPGHGEFFGEDFWTVGPGLHPETSFGSVAVLNGTDQVISTVFDPIYESFAGGLHKYSTLNGKKLSAIQLYNKSSSSYGKASGLGDLAIGNASLPVEIGNLAWIDENENGIQDPGEKPMAGLQLGLFDGQCRKVGETYTDQNGNYLFNASNVDSDGDGVKDGLKLLEPYFLVVTDSRIDPKTGHLVTVGDSLALTKDLVDPAEGLHDSDGEIGDGSLCSSWSGIPGIRILTGASGQNDYSFDLGFIRLKPTEVPEPEKIYDLALIKKVSGYAQPVAGDLVSFDLIIQNQGNQTIHQIQVTDYVKDYFSFESAANPGWTFSNGIARYTINNPVGAGQERLLSLSLRLNKTARPSEIINAAEISQMRDSLGQLLSDADSTPDEIENNDKGGVPNTETDNVLDNNAIDEDDHDRESLPIVDLALINRPVQTLPVKVNETAAFEMTVTNQGNVAVGRFEIVNYIPAGMIFDAGSNPGWTVLGNKAFRTINQSLQPGASHLIQINLIVKNRNQSEWIDLAEIRAMWDAQGNPLQDFDSTPDQDPLNDAGGKVATATDDVWSGDGTIDEDDHDPATLTQLDLALIMTNDETKPVVKNQDVLFHITVCNQGSVSVSKVGITNYLPAGLGLSPLDQHGWFAMGGVLQNNIHAKILPGGCATVDILLRVKEAAKPGDLVNRAEIISVQGLDQSDLSSRDMDSKPDFNMLNDAGGVPGSLTDNMFSGDGLIDEDDADPASLFIMDLALIKRYVSNGSLQYGGQAEFVIQVLNQGSSAVSQVEISDYMPSGFSLSAASAAAGWQQSGNILSYNYSGTLASGQETQIPLVLDQVSELDMNQMINRAEISAVTGVSGVDWSDRDFDSKADADPSNDAGGVPNSFTDNVVDLDASVDEDDADPAGIPVFDLALRKQLVDKKLAYRIGDTVSYNIQVFNQGNVIAKDIEIADYLHKHYLFIPELNPEWVEIEEGIYSYSIPGSLNPSESQSARMYLVITQLDEGNFIPNFAEIAFASDLVGNPGDDYDSVFDRIKDNDKGGEPRTAEDDLIGDHGEVDEDDHDGAESNPVNFDLALVKDVLQDVVKAGEVVQYTITVYNQGLVTAQEIELVEYVPAGLVLDDSDWSIGAADPEMTKAYYLMNEQNGRLPSGGLKSGEQVQVKLDLRVAADQLPGILVNRAEIFRAENYGHVVDDDSQPDDDLINDPGGVVFEDSDGSSADPEPGDSDDEDDADPAGIIVVDIDRTNPCQCLNNATNSVNGQFMEELSFRSLSNDTWFIFDVDGLYDPFSAPPPAAPTPFVTGPGGYILNEIPLGDGTSIYFIQGLHVDALGFSIVLSNQYGVKLSTGVHKCFYNDPVVLKAQNSVCSGQTVRYEVKRIPDASYLWTLSGGGTILTDPQSSVIDVEWTGSTGSSHVLTVTVNHPDSCYNPLEIPVIIGSEAGPVSCLGSAQVSLSFNCQVQITPSMLLLGGPYDYKSYAVMVMNKDGSLVPNNILTYDHIGKSFTAKVINVCSGNSCWSTVTVEDKVRPTITCLNDTIDCALMKSYLKPIINDNCDPDPERIILDEQIENTPCNPLYSKIVTRQYVAKDHSGNVSAPCVMQIFLKRIVLDSIVFPDSLSRRTFNPLICSHFAADALGHPLPSVSGVPYYRGLPAWPNNDSKYCDYAASYEDIELPTGKDCVRKILRNWKFTIWYCTTFEQRNYIQLIEIVDNEAPAITCPYDITATTNSVSCNANVWIPMPKASDLCGTILRFDLHHPGGLIQDFQASYVNIPEGLNVLTFTVYDQCHNSNSCSFTVTVEDRTPPVAVCDRETVVTLDRFGEAWVPASVFDDGSYDDCHIRSFEVRRMNVQESCNEGELNFRDSIRFCCADVGNEVMVIFRVTDFHGNENSCMVRVEVQDKTIPHIYCPHDVTISCDYHYDLNDLSEFGFPTVSDNCNVTFRDSVDVQINQCREGYIDRIFIAGNGFGQDVCVQRITVINPHPFGEKDITWPKDLDTTTCISNGLLPDVLPEIYGYPRIVEDFCDLAGISYEDHLFRFINGSDACYKIIRRWKVINWCRYGVAGINIPQSVFYHEQILKVNNKTGPVFLSGCKDTVFAIIDTACNGGDAYLVATAEDDCTPNQELVWEYHIDFNSDGIEDRHDYGVGATINASGFYPLGKHRIKYVFEDRCGNKAVCDRVFEIINCKPPVAYCKVGLSTSLVPMDMNGNGTVDAELVTIWAKDFDNGSYHPCGYPITYSFGRDTTNKSITYDCDSLGRRTVELCITASNGKQSCCTTFIDVQDNNNVSLCGCVTFPPNVTIYDCDQNVDPVVINSRPSIGNCTGCVHTSTTYRDSVVRNVPNTCFVVHRTWTVKFNCVGDPNRTFDRTQIIVVTTDLKDSDIQWPSDSVIVDNCSGNIDTAVVGEVPRFCVHGGSVMLMFRDRETRREQNCVFYERIWTVFSKCVPSQSFGFRQVLKVIEGTGVRYILPPNITVTDCRKPLLPDSLNGYPRTNCPCPIVIHSYRDSLAGNIPNTCYVIYRRWTSTFNCPPDVQGTYRGTQIITVRVDLRQQDIMWPADSVLVENCRGSVDTAIINNVPKLLKDFCGYVRITYSDREISNNDTCRIIHRTWVVSNDCSTAPNKQEFSFLQVLKVTRPDGPEVDFPDDITVTDCRQSLLPDSLNGYPELNCPCDNFLHTYQDSVVFGNPNTCYVVYRFWTSVYDCPPDVQGVFQGLQIITVRIQLRLQDIQWPSDTVIVDNCGGSVDTSLINHVPVLLKDFCGYVSITYGDSLVSSNDSCRIIHRRWLVSNDCSAAPNKQEFTFLQVLKVTNPDKPRIDFPEDITVTDCDLPLLPDSLNGYPVPLCTCESIQISYADDTLYTDPEVCYIVERTWSVEFLCEPNYDTTITHVQRIIRDVDLDPADIIWPIDSFTSYTCIPTLDPQFTGEPSLSKDYCGLIHFEFTDTEVPGGECRTIKRTWTAINDCSASQRPQFDQYLITKNQEPPSITCPNDTIVDADPGACGAVVPLRDPGLNNNCNGGVRFTNDAPSIFPVGTTVVTFTARDSCGNTAQCTTRVTVIETVPPEITCPDDLTIDCDVNTDSLTQFGLPDARDNCPGVIYTETVTRNQNICGIGTITRKFVAIDASGNRDSCTQTITIENADPLEDADMIWPLSPIGVGECESTDPMVTGSPAFDSTGISCLRASITYADTNLCSGNFCEIQRTWTVFDTCSNVTLNFVQHIIRNDPNAPNILGVRDTTLYASDTACNNYVPLVAYVDNCDSAMITITNNSPCCGNGMEDASGFYPVGTTSVTFIAEDGCCNVSRLTVRIIVIDTISPEVTCRKVVKKIRDDGCARFNSQEFIVRIGDNCTDSARIMTSFNRNNFMDTLRVFCCDSIRNYEYTAAVTVYFKDEAGNIDSCQTLLQAVDEDTICGPTFTSVIKGLVKSRKLTRMPGVEVMLNDGLMGMSATRSDGSYGFYDMANGGSYGLKAQHDLNPRNGVSTADIIHIQRHILGTVPFTDPLKFVAADVNNNRRITAADIVEIRKLVLGKTDRFAAVPSWKFLLSDYTFRDLEDPLSEDYKMEYTINKLNRNFYVDFTGVKMGDVDDSNDPVHFGGSITRSNNAILLVGQDQKLLKDQVYELELSLSQFRELDGMQFGVEVDPNLAILEGWEAVDGSGLTEDMVYLVPERNSFRVSYMSAASDPDTWTIRLKVRMKHAASWSEILRMESGVMPSEAYFKDGTIASVRLDFTDQYSSDATLSLYQNIPNPFRHATVIPFYTDQDAEIALRIVDLNGRVVFEQRNVFPRGYHELEIPRSKLNRSGMYYYQLKTKDSSLFRRMILTD